MDPESCEIFMKLKLFLALKKSIAAGIQYYYPTPFCQPLEAELEEYPSWWVSTMTLGTSYRSQLITPTCSC